MSLTLAFSLGDSDVTLGYDVSGAALHLANVGVESVHDTTYGSVALFGGTAYLQLIGSLFLSAVAGGEARTFSVWVKPFSASVALFSTGDDSASGGLLRVFLDASLRVNVEYTGIPDTVTTTTLILGEWAHVVISYDGSNVQCYVDGSLNVNESRDLATTDTLLSIGQASTDGEIAAFQGHMSDFRLYDYGLQQQSVSDLHEHGPNQMLVVEISDLTVFQHEGIQEEIVENRGAMAVGDVTTSSLNLVGAKAASGQTDLESFVYFHNDTTSESVCISEKSHAVDEHATKCTSTIKLGGDDGMQSCLQYGGDMVAITTASSSAGERVATVDFDGLSFDHDEAAVVIGPFLEYRIKYDDESDTLQIQHLEEGEYITKVEYGR
ncbi:unnamed protein product [Ectocarpus sp. 6 AP-2014]